MTLTPQDFVSKWKRAEAQELVEMRERWLAASQSQTSEVLKTSEVSGARVSGAKRTLTNLYNARPTWLDLAHKKLDAAVCAAYGWPDGLSDEEILEKLLALNLERANERNPKEARVWNSP